MHALDLAPMHAAESLGMVRGSDQVCSRQHQHRCSLHDSRHHLLNQMVRQRLWTADWIFLQLKSAHR